MPSPRASELGTEERAFGGSPPTAAILFVRSELTTIPISTAPTTTQKTTTAHGRRRPAPLSIPNPSTSDV